MRVREGIDVEGHVLVTRQVHDRSSRSTVIIGLGLGRELVEELSMRVLIDDDGQQAVLERVAAEDVREARGDDGPDAP